MGGGGGRPGPTCEAWGRVRRPAQVDLARAPRRRQAGTSCACVRAGPCVRVRVRARPCLCVRAGPYAPVRMRLSVSVPVRACA